MGIKTILQDGNPLLTQKSIPVDVVAGKPVITEETNRIIQDLEDTIRSIENAAGISAVQIGDLRNIVTIRSREHGILTLLNPIITRSSGEQTVVEACLSIKDRYFLLKRPYEVTVEAFDKNGTPITITARGFYAKLFCHELDHFDGILCYTKATSEISKEEAEAFKQEAAKSDNTILIVPKSPQKKVSFDPEYLKKRSQEHNIISAAKTTITKYVPSK